jgi:hypothetical protein
LIAQTYGLSKVWSDFRHRQGPLLVDRIIQCFVENAHKARFGAGQPTVSALLSPPFHLHLRYVTEQRSENFKPAFEINFTFYCGSLESVESAFRRMTCNHSVKQPRLACFPRLPWIGSFNIHQQNSSETDICSFSYGFSDAPLKRVHATSSVYASYSIVNQGSTQALFQEMRRAFEKYGAAITAL